MKLSNLLYAGMLSSLALVSCTDNDENSEWTGSEGVVFTTSIQSRVSGNSWNANDEVGIFMTPNGSEIASATAANKKYLAQTNGSLVAAPGEGVYLPATGKVDFIAYYPYSNALSGNVMDVNVADQSKPGAIDLLYSNETKGVEAANGKTIALKFVRKMSKITLDMTKDETIESFEGLKVEMKGIATEGKFDLAKGTVKATDGKNTQAVAMNIGNVEASTAKATAIILPTAAATDQTKMDLTFTLAGKTFTHSIADLTAFQAGKNVTFKATLSIHNGKPVVTVGNATIENWVGVTGGDFDVNFDGEGGGTEPGEEKVLLDESFATSQGAFTIDNKVMPSELTYVWNHDDRNGGYMKASGHINKPTPVDYATESWLISPELDLTTATTATLTFDHAVNFAKDMQTQQTLWVKEVGTENWQQVTIATYPAGNSWDFISSGNIDLSAQKGKKVQLGFKYVSTDQGAATWEIKNVKVVADGKGGTVDPTPEPEPEPEPQPQPTPSGTELYISEYVEGGSFNKYIELYNPTEQDIDLSQYTLGMHNYSKDAAGGNDNGIKTQVLSGTLKSKQVIVYKHTDAVAYTGTVVDLGKDVMNFNGNDPIILYKGEEVIDFLGVENSPFGKDVTLRRKVDASAPSATYDENQWEKAGKDDVTGLGKR